MLADKVIASEEVKKQIRWLPVAFLAATSVAIVVWALSRGQDTNWDLQNYHQYAPWAIVHGAYSRDVLAGNWQSYFNPAIYFIRFATHWVGPVASAAIVATLQSLAMIPVYLVARSQFSREAAGRAFALAALATMISAASPVFLGEMGTSFADSLLAIPILLAILVLEREKIPQQ